MARGLGGSLMSRILNQIREYMKSLGVRNPVNDAGWEARTYGGEWSKRGCKMCLD